MPKPKPIHVTPKLRERFMSKLQRAEGCWEWTGTINPGGYGRLPIYSPGGRCEQFAAHRVSYTIFVGPIPDGLELDHLCRNRRCVRPDHLEPVTPQVNVLRGMGPPAIVVRTGLCRKGHPTKGRCRLCTNERERKRRRLESPEERAARLKRHSDYGRTRRRPRRKASAQCSD